MIPKPKYKKRKPDPVQKIQLQEILYYMIGKGINVSTMQAFTLNKMIQIPLPQLRATHQQQTQATEEA